ncbi:MAG: Gfo/Idh/MocA family oxidoreductase [Nitriliruptoraceae bacterium]
MTWRWGIMGTGIIADAFAAAIRAEGGTIVAVSSATPARAERFAVDHGIGMAVSPHAALLEHDDLEVVYIATTNERHHLDAHACLAAGIPALVEKPFALDAETARTVLETAARSKVFIAEAMWMRLQPAITRLHAALAAGTIGAPAAFHASIGVLLDLDPTRRWRSAELGGGALLDLGVYPATLAHDLLGPVTAVRATGQLADTGVDVSAAVLADHERGTATWRCSFTEASGVWATVAGPEGSIWIGEPFHHAPSLSLRPRDQAPRELPIEGHELGYRYEVREVHRCLETGALESPALRHSDTVAVLEVLDEVGAQLGVRRPPVVAPPT